MRGKLKSAKDGGVEKPCRVFALQKLEVHQCTGGILLNRRSLYDGQLEFADANIAGLITGGIRAATAKDGGQIKQ